jgi:hypothetical protein
MGEIVGRQREIPDGIFGGNFGCFLLRHDVPYGVEWGMSSLFIFNELNVFPFVRQCRVSGAQNGCKSERCGVG